MLQTSALHVLIVEKRICDLIWLVSVGAKIRLKVYSASSCMRQVLRGKNCSIGCCFYIQVLHVFNMFSGLGTYFCIKHGLRKDAIHVLLEKLHEIEKWFESQRRFSFYASSLLMIYEGDTQQNDYFTRCNHCHKGDCLCCTTDSEHTDSTDNSDNASSGVTDNTDLTSSQTVLSEMDTASSGQTDNSSLTASVSSMSVDTQSTSGSSGVNNHNAVLADVRMIDFTHVFNVDERDDNYLYGLKNLISNMQQLLDS